jgi:site-specific DNA recombinase
MANCIIYSRVSTQDQQTDRQIKELQEYAAYKKYTLLAVFEEKITGTSKTSDRLAFKKLLDFIEKNKVDNVLIWELSRIGRSMSIIHDTVELLTNKGINLFSKKEGMNTFEDNGKKSITTSILIAVLSGFAEMEHQTFKLRSSSGIRQNVATGGSGTGVIKAYGFSKIDKKLVINEKEAEVIKLIFRKYLSGLGTGQIAKFLNTQKIPTRYNTLFGEKQIKGKFGTTKKGKDYVWRDGTIYSILTNSIYKGERKHKGEIFKIEQIIEEDIYNRVQTRLTENYNKSNSARKYDNYLKDVLFCGKCGKTYFMHKRADNKDNAYKCLSKRYHEFCGNPSINIDKLLDTLLIIGAPLLANDELDKKGKGNVIQENLENKQIEFDNLKKEVEKLNSKLDKLVKMHLEEEITIKQYSSMKTEVLNELGKKEKRLEKLSEELERIKNIKEKSEYNGQYPEQIFKENIKDSVEFIKVYEVQKLERFKDVFPSTVDVGIIILAKSILNNSYVHCMISRWSQNLAYLKFKTNNIEKDILKGNYSIAFHKPIPDLKLMFYPKKKARVSRVTRHEN